MSNRRQFLGQGLLAAPAVAAAAVGVDQLLPEAAQAAPAVLSDKAWVLEKAAAEAGSDVTAGRPEPEPKIFLPEVLPGKRRKPKVEARPSVVSACVSSSLLAKADRLFQGDVAGRIAEVVQNARRAGATQLWVTTVGHGKNQTVTIQDDGYGIQDFGNLLKLGFSNWADEVDAAEDPAGAGFFSLAPRDVLACSKGRQIQLTKEGWLGQPIRVTPSAHKCDGLLLQFVDEAAWSKDAVLAQTEYGGLLLTYNGAEYPAEPFLQPDLPSVHLPEFGVRLQFVPSVQRFAGLGQVFPYRSTHGILNFHGQLVQSTGLPTVLSDLGVWVLVDMTGEPTSLRLQLPDRRALCVSPVQKTLFVQIGVQALRSVDPNKPHSLSFELYTRIRREGVPLIEARPCYREGVGVWDDSTAREIQDASGELRVRSTVDEDSDGRTIDLLTGSNADWAEKYAPVQIADKYEGYSWTKTLDTIVAVELLTTPAFAADGEKLRAASVHLGDLQLVTTLAAQVTFATPDGGERVEEYPLPLAATGYTSAVMTVAEFQSRNYDDQVLYCLLGGWDEDHAEGDEEASWEEYHREIDALRCRLQNKYEYARQQLVAAMDEFLQSVGVPNGSRKAEKHPGMPGADAVPAHVTIVRDGTVMVNLWSPQEQRFKPIVFKPAES